MLTSACSLFEVLGNLCNKQTEKQPRLEYINTRKVCLRVYSPHSTLRRVYDTPRGSHPCIV